MVKSDLLKVGIYDLKLNVNFMTYLKYIKIDVSYVILAFGFVNGPNSR